MKKFMHKFKRFMIVGVLFLPMVAAVAQSTITNGAHLDSLIQGQKDAAGAVAWAQSQYNSTMGPVLEMQIDQLEQDIAALNSQIEAGEADDLEDLQKKLDEAQAILVEKQQEFNEDHRDQAEALEELKREEEAVREETREFLDGLPPTEAAELRDHLLEEAARLSEEYTWNGVCTGVTYDENGNRMSAHDDPLCEMGDPFISRPTQERIDYVNDLIGDIDNRLRDDFFEEVDADRGFFTPKVGDLSVAMLGQVFGTVGSVLPGGRNQLLGTLIGVFNLAWVVAIGIGILWIVWTSVISAAGSGEMMGGRGKKSVFNIMRIVIGFSLVVPSASTGYSLAQVGVMWIAVQGVGMASRISDLFHETLKTSGNTAVVSMGGAPEVSGDLDLLLPTNRRILQSEICMYKLQDIMDRENELNQEARNELEDFTDVIAPIAPNEDATVGYSINDDYTITFGTRNPDAVEGEYLFNDECGKIVMSTEHLTILNRLSDMGPNETVRFDEWYLEGDTDRLYKDIAMRLSEDGHTPSLTDEFSVADIQQLVQEELMYKQLATMEAVLQMQAAARSIASGDIIALKEKDPEGALRDYTKKGAMSMAVSTVSFATIVDPLRINSVSEEQAQAEARADVFKELGWLYTPIAVLNAATYDINAVGKVSDYGPAASGPDMERMNALSTDDQAALEAAIQLPVDDWYELFAYYSLEELTKHSNIGGENPIGHDGERPTGVTSGTFDFLNFSLDDIGGFLSNIVPIPGLSEVTGFMTDVNVTMVNGTCNFFADMLPYAFSSEVWEEIIPDWFEGDVADWFENAGKDAIDWTEQAGKDVIDAINPGNWGIF